MEKIQENHTIDLFVRGRLFSYVAGVASYICEWYHIGGLHLESTKMDMPMKSGLSSSAAICVMVAKAFNLLYGLHMSTIGVMNIAYWGGATDTFEMRPTGSGVCVRCESGSDDI